MRVKRMFCSFLFHFFLINLFSQSFSSFPSVGSLSTKNVHQGISNPALPGEKSWEFSLAYKNNFSLPDIHYLEAIGRVSFNESNHLMISFQSDRFLDLSRSMLGIGLTKKLHPHFYAGLFLQIQRYKILEYGSRINPSFRLGVLHKISKEWEIYTSFDSPFKFNEIEIFKSKAMLGLNYQISPLVLCQVKVEKEYRFDLQFIPGIEYEISEQLYFNVQYFSAASSFQFSLGVQLKNKLQMNISLFLHPFFDWNPGFNLSSF